MVAENEIENVIQAFWNARDSGDCQAVIRLFEAVLDILFTLGLFDDRVAMGRATAECARALGLPEKEALAWSVVSSTQVLRAEYAAADEALTAGREAAERSGDVAAITYQRRCLAYSLYRQGHVDQARQSLSGALDESYRAGDLQGAVDVAALLSAAAVHDSPPDAARAAVDAFDDAVERAQWRRATAYPAREYAELALWSRDLTAAAQRVEHGLSVASEFRDRRQLVRLHLTEGRIAMFRGDLEEALTKFNQALHGAQELRLANELSEINAHVRLASRRPRGMWRIWLMRRPVRRRLTEAAIGGD